MREFFKGWRRKIGVVTLAMACVFAALWAINQQIQFGFTRISDGIAHIWLANSFGITRITVVTDPSFTVATGWHWTTIPSLDQLECLGEGQKWSCWGVPSR